jgi:protein TonB
VSVRGGAGSRSFGVLAMSTSVHVIVFSMLGLIPSPSQVLAMHESEFEVLEQKPVPEPEPPKIKEPEPEPPPPEPVKAPRRAAAPQPTEAPPPPENAPKAAEEVADFTGVTLTAADGSGSWSSAVGSGGALKGPVGKIGARAPAKTVQDSAKAVQAGPRVVALGSLARKPSAPQGLSVLLERNFPQRARLQGVEGTVTVNLRILPSGRVGDIRVVKEWPAGFDFAAACRETLRQAPPWVAPLDHSGTAVAADITFVCTFEVAY